MRRKTFNRPRTYLSLIIPGFLCFEIAVRLLARLITQQTGTPFFVCYAVGQLVILLLAGRWIAIYIIMVYQHYAPDHVRRRCHCIPSCSQYAIEALKRHGLWRGIWMAYRRVRYTCDGSYKEDPVPE